jgi:phosphatidylinositol dimannoside acyltransferase
VTEAATPKADAPEETIIERVHYGIFAAVERAAMTLPEFVGRRLFDLGGLAAFHLALGMRGVVEANLSRVLGRKPGSPLVRAAARDSFRSYARYWYDSFRIAVMPDEEFVSRCRGVGREHLERAVEAGRGAVLALPHVGNYDVAGHWVAATGFRITAVAEELKPQRLYQLFCDRRRGLGLGIVALSSDRKVADELVRLIGENELIALVADRDLTGRGVDVEMFGATRRMPAGPALLSLFTGSPLLPCALYDLEHGWAIHIDAPLEIERTENMRQDVTALTRLLAKRFERSIAAAPTQWHMFQPFWNGSGPLGTGAGGPS